MTASDYLRGWKACRKLYLSKKLNDTLDKLEQYEEFMEEV